MKKMAEIAIIIVLVIIFTSLGDALGGSIYGRGSFAQSLVIHLSPWHY